MELRYYRQADYEQAVKLDELTFRGTNDVLRDPASAAADLPEGGEIWVGEREGSIMATGVICLHPAIRHRSRICA